MQRGVCRTLLWATRDLINAGFNLIALVPMGRFWPLALKRPRRRISVPARHFGNRSAQVSRQLIGNVAPCSAVNVACDEDATALPIPQSVCAK
jgi:hypothetical protein